MRASINERTTADRLAAQNSSSVYLNSTVRSWRAAIASHKVELISGVSLVTSRHSAKIRRYTGGYKQPRCRVCGSAKSGEIRG